MHAKTALAVAGSVLAVPSAALAAATMTAADQPRCPASVGQADPRRGSEGWIWCGRTSASPDAWTASRASAGCRRCRERPPRPQRAPAQARVAPRPRPHRRSSQAIAACESGGNPATNTGNGFYGKYQFTQRPGRASAAPATPPPPPRPSRTAAPPRSTRSEGASPWPVCGQ